MVEATLSQGAPATPSGAPTHASHGVEEGGERAGGTVEDSGDDDDALPSLVEGRHRQDQWLVSSMTGFKALAASGFAERPTEAQLRAQTVR